MRKNIVVLISLLFALVPLINKHMYGMEAIPEQLVLIPHHGYFNAYIVIPQRAIEIERYAAEELKEYIQKITGGVISVIKEQPNLEYFGFYIGRTEKGERYKQPVTSPYDGANGFRIKSVPNGFIIIGADDLSTLFGVYAFLEEYQGCGWFLPNELNEVVPHNKGILIPKNIDETQVPDIPIRWIGNGEWALKNRMNTEVRIHGHEVGVINKWNFHTFGILMPPKRYFIDHPEYYSFVNARRTSTGEYRWQLCTSNPEVVKLVSLHVIENLQRDPSIQFISLTPNDGGGFCKCGQCLKQAEPARLNDHVGENSGPIHIFNNQVAQRVKKFCPTQRIKIGAYASYYRYPLAPSFTFEDNLAIQVTPNIQFCHNHTITDRTCPHNADFMNEFSKWVKNSKHLHIYGYAILRGWATLLWPMVHCMKQDITEYHRDGVELFFTQTGYIQSYALNFYVASRLIWNTSLNVNDLITEFCRKMYGTAAPEMEGFHRFIEDSCANNNHHVGYDVEPVFLSVPKFFPAEMVVKADQLLREAENIDADSLSKKRIHIVRIEFDYLRLVLNYLDTILKPFQGIDPERDPIRWENAGNQAASIGEVLSNNILKYMNEYCPETMKSYWGGGIEGILRNHTRLSRVLKVQRGK